MLAAIIARAKTKKLLPKSCEIAIDATGLDSQYKSSYFFMRSGRRHERKHFLKLTATGCTRTQFIFSASVGLGPSNDSPALPGCVRAAAEMTEIKSLLADAAYDCEGHHALCREELGIGQTIIPARKRKGPLKPKTPYRREMHRRFPKKKYGQRWQIESVFSCLKRRIGGTLYSKNRSNQTAEVLLTVLVYDLMILALRLSIIRPQPCLSCALFYRAMANVIVSRKFVFFPQFRVLRGYVYSSEGRRAA